MGELTLSFALTLQIQTDHGMVITLEMVQCILQSLLLVASHSSHMMSTSGQKGHLAVGEKF